MNTSPTALRKIITSSYIRAITQLSTGQLLATGLPILAAPILGRLYLPADYGALAMFMALAGLFGAISTLQLPLGIIAERSERSSIDLVVASIVLASGFALIAAIVAFALFFGLGGNSSYGDARVWILMLPVTVLASGITAGVAALANRRAAYGALARIPPLAAAVTVGTSIAFGLLGFGADGLFLSYFLGQGTGLAAHLFLGANMGIGSASWNPHRLFAVGWRNRNFAFYTVPSQLLSVLSLGTPIYALSISGDLGLLGAFHRARSLVFLPLSLLGGAVAQVFRQRASEDYRKLGSCRRIYVQTALCLLGIGLPPMTILLLYGPDLFRLVLGPNWGEAGEVARIMAPMLLLRLVCSPLSTVFFITGRQKEDLLLGICAAILCGGLVFAIFPLNLNPDWVVSGFTISYSIIYLVYIVLGFKFATA